MSSVTVLRHDAVRCTRPQCKDRGVRGRRQTERILLEVAQFTAEMHSQDLPFKHTRALAPTRVLRLSLRIERMPFQGDY